MKSKIISSVHRYSGSGDEHLKKATLMRKKLTFLLCTLLFTVLTFGQKIQIKKDKILYDKVEIATITEPYRDHYEFSTLSGEKKFSVDFKGLSVNNTQFYQWLEVTSADGKIKTEIPHDVLINAFDVKRIIAHNLSVKYNLLDASGINDSALKTFFETQRESLSDKYGKTVATAQIEADAQKKKVQEIKARYNPQIQNDKSITFTQGGKLVIVGRLVTEPYIVGGGARDYAYLYDIDGNKAVSLGFVSLGANFKLTGFDGKSYDFVTKSMYSEGNTTFLNEFLWDAVSRGYTLGHQIRDENAKLYAAKVALAKERSVNIYNKKGYLVDGDGKRYDGIISIYFQMLDVNETGQVLPEDAADNFGKRVSITYRNEKNQERTKTFKASSNAYFCITENNKETFYYGMAVKGEAMKKIQNIGNFAFDNAFFFQMIHKEDKIMVLHDPVETEKYVIKITPEAKGQMLDRRSTENLSVQLADYLKACKSLSDDIKKNEFDLKIEDNLIRIAQEYQNCK
ncbi:MAG TPA: hypothetical protein PKN96_05580 [Flavobacterium sp.]|uniref:hypothetical protein n=1 Tax=Flavobacterium sp. TaxID=239 RepID=UPI002C5C087C|nr:hypothetical protein [Flavobacterium sp.]HNP32744.1 hypothetical protein [Flavobacterium sp.]